MYLIREYYHFDWSDLLLAPILDPQMNQGLRIVYWWQVSHKTGIISLFYYNLTGKEFLFTQILAIFSHRHFVIVKSREGPRFFMQSCIPALFLGDIWSWDSCPFIVRYFFPDNFYEKKMLFNDIRVFFMSNMMVLASRRIFTYTATE